MKSYYSPETGAIVRAENKVVAVGILAAWAGVKVDQVTAHRVPNVSLPRRKRWARALRRALDIKSRVRAS